MFTLRYWCKIMWNRKLYLTRCSQINRWYLFTMWLILNSRLDINYDEHLQNIRVVTHTERIFNNSLCGLFCVHIFSGFSTLTQVSPLKSILILFTFNVLQQHQQIVLCYEKKYFILPFIKISSVFDAVRYE